MCRYLQYNYFPFRQRSQLQYNDDYSEERDSGLESLQLSFTMLDSPEAILKKRISELEKMEQHQKQQVFLLYPTRYTNLQLLHVMLYMSKW